MSIDNKDRLIVALDVPEADRAKQLVNELGDGVSFYKIGMELMMTGDYFDLLDWLVKKDKKVFVDLKLFDVPATVSKAIKRLSNRGAYFTTIHGNQSMMEAAAAEKGDLKVLAVTALTSLDQGDLNDMGFTCDIQELVISRAKRALSSGCDGIVASGLELEHIRNEVDQKLIIVTPGIRPVHNRPTDDQKRVVTVEEAFQRGADHIVVGRPIQNADSPKQAALDIQETIESVFH
ncbi:MAG TPA: orotidine-5'-phosphate decarboxylase [Candidatus Thioglobus sp.]|jgi:orotidine-5'-phosphate decarboxylase|nr:orotidine-5'-phosphate decarboxylase [Candidatus Thioglobus sp.]HIK77257.1 orotidine-5'-phosphate decarboxylase [Gammaproteobacteria bacterium]